MTSEETAIAHRLMRCSLIPGSFDKRFIKQLKNWYYREMTQAGKETLIRLFHKYRRQIPDYEELNKQLLESKENKESGQQLKTI